jgi:hypothetical protein
MIVSVEVIELPLQQNCSLPKRTVHETHRERSNDVVSVHSRNAPPLLCINAERPYRVYQHHK